MSHYYLNDNKIKDDINTIKVIIDEQNFTFKTNSGVFSKQGLDYGSRLLINNVLLDDNVSNIADLGSGYGPIGIILAYFNKQINVNLYEINERAVLLAKENALLNKVKNVKVFNNNILENVKTNFDVVVTNPPIRAGKDVVFSFYEQAYKHLNNNGFLYVVIQKKQGAESSLKFISSFFQKTEIIAKSKGYWIIKAKKIILID